MKFIWNNMTFIPYVNCYGIVIGNKFFGYAKFRNYIVEFGNNHQNIQWTKNQNPKTWMDV